MRTITVVEEHTHDGHVAQVIPAGAKGIILHTWSDGSHRAELVIAPRTEEYDDDDDGGLVEVTLTEGQYEVIPSLCQKWTMRPRWEHYLGDRAMNAAREYESVRTTTDIVSDDGRTIPAGMRALVLNAKPEGTSLDA